MILRKCFAWFFVGFLIQQASGSEILNRFASPTLRGVRPLVASKSNQLDVCYFSTFSDRARSFPERKTIRILSIDGGGIRGVVPLTFLKHIEQQTKKPISDSFDIISGTSTGGIIALGLCVPDAQNKPKYDVEDLRKIYKTDNGYIFSNPFWADIPLVGPLAKKAHDLVYAKYSKEGLESTLHKYFETENGGGRVRLSRSLKTVLVPAFNMRESKLHLFDSDEARRDSAKDFYMTDAAYSTAAAPTYFPPARVRNCDNREEYKLIDGGVVANNPSLLALLKANEMFGSKNNFFILSLGTGQKTFKTTPFRELKNSGLFHWAFHMPRLMINASNSNTEHCLKELKYVNNVRVMRLQIELDDRLMRLDSTHTEVIDELERLAKEEIEKKRKPDEPGFTELLEVLSKREN